MKTQQIVKAHRLPERGRFDFSNEGPPIAYDTGGGYRGGEILFANDARMLETFYSEPLTTYRVGWRDPNDIEGTLNFFAPPVTVGRRFEWKKAVNAEEFLSEVVDDQRGIGADFKRVEYTASDVTDKTINKGLTYIVDLDNVNLNDPNWQNNVVGKLSRRLYRNELRRAVTLISAAATNTNKTWSSGTNANPDQDIKDDLVTATTATGIRPNRISYGDSAFNNRSKAYENVANTATAYANAAVLTGDALAQRLMVDKLIVSRERYQSAAGSKSEILGNVILAFYAEDGVDTEDPSNVKRFVSLHSPEQGGGLFAVYAQQLSQKLFALTVSHYSKTVVTFATGIRKWTIS